MSEVLVSILIASIGLVSVATMFPLSVAKTIVATQRTHATVLKRNAEEWLDRSRWAPPVAVVRTTPHPQFQHWPPRDQRNVLDLPQFRLGADGIPAGVNGDALDNFNFVVVDPLGVATHLSEDFPLGATGASRIPRVHGQLLPFTGTKLSAPPYTDPNFLSACRTTALLPDSWTELLVADSVSAPTATSVTIPGAGAMGYGTLAATSPAIRIELFDLDGRRSFVRRVSAITAANVVSWNETADLDGNGILDRNAMPTATSTPAFTPASARLDVVDQRFSWMLLARKIGFVTEVDCVVFFKRGFQAEGGQTDFANEERVYTGSLSGAAANRQILFTEKPKYAKRGGFFISTDDLHAYRIQNISDDGLTIRLVRADGNELAGVTGANAAGEFRGVFMRGIVDVYSLGAR